MALAEIVFLHFNDVYHISKQIAIARFLTQLGSYRDRFQHLSPYTVFSGDCFSPSLESSILRGAHMIPLLKELRIDVACYGNHDFDFGEHRLRELSSQTHFPWLLSNAFRKQPAQSLSDMCIETNTVDDDCLLASAYRYHTTSLQGYKIGFFGLAGTDWPSNCRELPSCTIAPPIDVSRACSRYLRSVAKCDFVIALTHMRLAEDMAVSEALRTGPAEERLDLLLGGHDHEVLRRYGGPIATASPGCNHPAVIDCTYSGKDNLVDANGVVAEATGDIRVVKSGTNWESISCIRLLVDRTTDGQATIKSVAVEQVKDLDAAQMDAPSLEMNVQRVEACLRDVNSRIESLVSDPLVQTAIDLEGTGSVIRAFETNLGNMLADMVRSYHVVDIALVNSGSIRCGRVIPKSSPEKPLTVRDLIDILPFENAIVVKRVSSHILLDALENSFSDAHTDGRFLQYSGLSVVADWGRPEGRRVMEVWHYHRDESGGLRRTAVRREDSRYFTIAMAEFIADGFDGYTCFRDSETLVTAEGAITDTQLLLRTMGYGRAEDVAEHDEALQRDIESFKRAQEQVVSSWDGSSGLPVLMPKTEGRIVTRRSRASPSSARDQIVLPKGALIKSAFPALSIGRANILQHRRENTQVENRPGFLGATVFYPSAINGVVYSQGKYTAPRPYGPSIPGRGDGKKNKDRDLLAEAIDVVYGKAHFKIDALDDYFTHHEQFGDLHCGTNVGRDASGVPWWMSKGGYYGSATTLWW